MTNSLYARYMEAHRALRTHLRSCGVCTDDHLCADGQQLFRALTSLQDQYLAAQKRKRN
ncbi:hypothetical protein ABZ714_26575 [Streptomyces sp. NPDC006798]|uniref:hypothetical protein n=1 Tax=Streptomyces sp. NPDC006798 TaxID=3155462 RepID=UPI003411A92B